MADGMIDHIGPGLPPALAAELAGIRAGTAKRRSMDPAFYTDAGVLAAERAAVFACNWVCVGRADEIAKPGDYFVTEILEDSLIVARGKDGAVRVMSNVCRHRGSLIAHGRGSAKRFTCPYHAWTYGLDGGLVRAPLVDEQEGFDKTSCALPQVSFEEWMGWIFVNLDGTAAPLGPQLEDLDPYVRNYHPEDMRAHDPRTDIWGVNWKGLAENFMEGYHLTPVHLKTLHPMTPTRLCEKIPGGGLWTGYKAHYDDAFEGRTEVHPDMTEEERRLSMMVWIYPGFVLGLGPNSATYMSLLPHGPDAVSTRWDTISRAGMSHDQAQARWDFAASFNAEDKERLESMQRGLHSRFASGGPLAPDDFEGTIWDFYGWMANQLATPGT